MKPKPFHIYFGRILWHNDEPGYRLRWSCLGIGAANTLACMKRLVREHIKPSP